MLPSLTREEQAVLACHISQSLTPNRLFKYLRAHRDASSGLSSKETSFETSFETPFSWHAILSLTEHELKKRRLIHPSKTYEGATLLLDRAQEQQQSCAKHHIQIITYASPTYPSILRKIPLPPLVLYCKGTLPGLDYERDHAVAIVGARSSEVFINDFVVELAKAIVSYGGLVISGMALGVDGAAHLGALQGFVEESRGSKESPGATLAVVASGVDYIYPYANRKLYDDILTHNGCILSEYPLGTKPLNYHFPLRNRIIAGLAREVFIAQASIKSGALITAQYALEYGRDVYTYGVETVDPLPEAYAGNLKLAEEGAHAIRSVTDFLKHTGLSQDNEVKPSTLASPYTAPQALMPQQLTEDPNHTIAETVTSLKDAPKDEASLAYNVLLLLKHFPASTQELAQKLGIAPTLLAPLLMELVLDNKIREVSPNRYMLKK